ncbi:RES family NAD+ phosphorylase [Streptomyces sp. NPDC021354]|uniref:RES family NAD+ phosphorylase n=1 Tax=unclassified Streptomyces TaxID=2593676 RepID=UPI0033CDB447
MSPTLVGLDAGTELWRCHQTTFPCTEFNPVAAHAHFGGSRFDGTSEDPYPYLYAGLDPTTALAEVLLRDVEFSGPEGMRQVPWAQAAIRSLAKLRVTEDLVLVRLFSERDLAAVFQTSWLLETEGPGYAQTRAWAREIRRQVPRAQGLLWQSRRNRPEQALVLFGDRCGAEPLKAVPGHAHNLGTFEGTRVANELLVPLRAVIVPPGMRM